MKTHHEEKQTEAAVPTNAASSPKPLTAPHALIGEDLVRGNIVRYVVYVSRVLC
jgi:hypothetical protein